MVHNKFQISRTILSGRIRVPVVGWGGWWGVCKVIIVSNPTRLRLGCGWVVVRLGFWQYWQYLRYSSILCTFERYLTIPYIISSLLSGLTSLSVLNTILQYNIEEYLAIFANIVQHMLIFITIRFILAISNSFVCHLKILLRFYYFETFCLVT